MAATPTFQGCKLQGLKIGQVSPLDNSGLKFWIRATDGVKYLRSNMVSQWNDLSGNNINLTPTNGTAVTTNAGQMYSTPYGLGWGANSGTSYLSTGNASYWNFLVNGSAYTIILVYAVRDVSTSGTGLLMLAIPSVNPQLQISQAAGIASRHINAAGTSMYILDATPVLTVGSSIINTETNYGYGSTVTPLLTNAINGVIKTQLNAYTTAPDAAAVFGNPLAFFANSKRYLYEAIIYNQTGKSNSQIDAEIAKLTTEYLKPRYPGIY